MEKKVASIHSDPELKGIAKSKHSIDSDSVLSGASTRKGLRMHLAETTDVILAEVFAVLKN